MQTEGMIPYDDKLVDVAIKLLSFSAAAFTLWNLRSKRNTDSATTIKKRRFPDIRFKKNLNSDIGFPL
jgi:hypothetical protein